MLSTALLVFTLLLVLASPWGVGGAWWAALGGAVALLTGLVTPGQAVGVLSEAINPLVLVVGMMVLAGVAEKAGFFDWVASLAVRAGGGRVARLFVLTFLFGCLVTAVLSLDTTAIILTPIVFGMVSRLGLRPLPFVFACAYSANTASLFLPVSNLTNLLAYDAFDLGFAGFVLLMLPPAVLAVLANLLVFRWLFREELRGDYGPHARPFAPENRIFFRTAVAAVVGVLFAFFLAPLSGVPLGFVALAAATLLAGTARIMGWMSLGEVVRSVSWDALVLVVGLFLVVGAAQGAGIGALAEELYAAAAGSGFAQILTIAGTAALGSNLLNNLPATLVALHAAGAAEGVGATAVYATVVGTGVGPNLTVVGSLATLIWLSILRQKGVKVSALDYLKVGVISTPPILLCACVGLWISLRLFGP